MLTLTPDQKLWLLTADPDTWALSSEAPAWLVVECIKLGLVQPGPESGTWRLTIRGGEAWREVLGLG